MPPRTEYLFTTVSPPGRRRRPKILQNLRKKEKIYGFIKKNWDFFAAEGGRKKNFPPRSPPFRSNLPPPEGQKTTPPLKKNFPDPPLTVDPSPTYDHCPIPISSLVLNFMILFTAKEGCKASYCLIESCATFALQDFIIPPV